MVQWAEQSDATGGPLKETRNDLRWEPEVWGAGEPWGNVQGSEVMMFGVQVGQYAISARSRMWSSGGKQDRSVMTSLLTWWRPSSLSPRSRTVSNTSQGDGNDSSPESSHSPGQSRGGKQKFKLPCTSSSSSFSQKAGQEGQIDLRMSYYLKKKKKQHETYP